MTRSTYYELLGIESDASPDEIRDARRRRLVVVHPDRGRSADDRARREQLSAAVNLAADTLLDPRTRRIYDRRLGIRTPIIPPAAARVVRRGSAPVIHTRIGQWAILLGIATLAAATGLDRWAVGVIAVVVALLLARPGEPTPVRDIEIAVSALGRFLRGPGARVGRAAATAAGASFRERLAEAKREAEGGAATSSGVPPRRPSFSVPDDVGEQPPSARGAGRARHR